MTFTTTKMVQQFAKGQLTYFQKQFIKSPSALHSRLVTHYMMVYQQAMQLDKPSCATVRDDLLKQLDTLPVGVWDERVVVAVTGLSVADAVRHSARDL